MSCSRPKCRDKMVSRVFINHGQSDRRMAGTNGGNNGKGIVLTYIARRLQRSLVTRGCRSVDTRLLKMQQSRAQRVNTTLRLTVMLACSVRVSVRSSITKSERIMLLRVIDWLKGIRTSWTNVFKLKEFLRFYQCKCDLQMTSYMHQIYCFFFRSLSFADYR